MWLTLTARGNLCHFMVTDGVGSRGHREESHSQRDDKDDGDFSLPNWVTPSVSAQSSLLQAIVELT